MANIKRANTSGVTKSGVAIADVPDTPTIGTATAGIESATVTYTAATTGGTGSTFTATSTPGSVTGTGSSPITVAGLTADTSYTFTVRASNSTGNSPFSAASNSVTALSKLAFESIATVTVGSSQSTITFSSIPATFKHLEIRHTARLTRAGNSSDGIAMNFNGDTSTNYSNHYLRGDGSSVASANAWTNKIAIDDCAATTATAGIMGVGVWSILDYANTNKYKTARILDGSDQNGSGGVQLVSGNWRNTDAITSIVFTNLYGTFFEQHTSFALYGIKG